MKPNVVLFMTDQQRWDSLGCYGNSAVITPNIDKLADDGILCKNAYSTCPACVPARGNLLTGLNAFHLGSLTYEAALKPQYKTTLPQLLKSEGYQTIAIGKNHFTPQRAKHGYDKLLLDESGRIESKDFLSDYMKWFEEQTGTRKILADSFDFNGFYGSAYPFEEWLHPTAWTKNMALEQLHQMNLDHPFFLKISFARPHSPYDAPKRWYDYYDGQSLPMPVKSDKSRTFRRTRGGKTKWRGESSEAENHRARAGYYGNVSFIDEAVGEVIEELKRLQIYDTSIIIFLSDHGDMLGDHNLWRKSYAYEGSSHIPLIIKPPKPHQNEAHILNTPVSLYDILPTIMHMINPDTEFCTDGIDILGQTRPYVLGEYMLGYEKKMDMQFICDGKFKFIWYMRQGKFELYDLRKDKYECHNLAYVSDYAEQMEAFSQIIKKEMRKYGIDVSGKGLYGLKRYRFQLPYDKYGRVR